MRTYPLVGTDVGEALDHLSENAGTRAAARAVLDGHKKDCLPSCRSWDLPLSLVSLILIPVTLLLISRAVASLAIICCG